MYKLVFVVIRLVILVSEWVTESVSQSVSEWVMSSAWSGGQEEEEEDGEDIDEEFKSHEDHILFLLDARSSMFELNNSREVRVAIAVFHMRSN